MVMRWSLISRPLADRWLLASTIGPTWQIPVPVPLPVLLYSMYDKQYQSFHFVLLFLLFSLLTWSSCVWNLEEMRREVDDLRVYIETTRVRRFGWAILFVYPLIVRTLLLLNIFVSSTIFLSSAPCIYQSQLD
jgi:hypothetical protein